VACHAPPNFTDFKFHNVGATQEEYDAIHGSGAFSALRIPSLAERQADPDAFLPASAKHPFAEGRFRAVPSALEPQNTDLGLWNIFANPDHPLSQAAILRALTGGRPATKAALLPKTIALFKTPGLRDLADSGPYLHTGRKDTLVDVVDLYRTNSSLQRAGALRNGATELSAVSILPTDEASLAAFLTSLTEDYE
jgi:cytochrome c peroxidase